MFRGDEVSGVKLPMLFETTMTWLMYSIAAPLALSYIIATCLKRIETYRIRRRLHNVRIVGSVFDVRKQLVVGLEPKERFHHCWEESANSTIGSPATPTGPSCLGLIQPSMVMPLPVAPMAKLQAKPTP